MKRLTMLVAVLAAVAVSAEDFPGWFLSGGGSKNYEAIHDRNMRHGGGSSALLRAKSGNAPDGYATLMQSFSAEKFVGKRVRLSAYLRTSGTTGRVDFWSRVQAACSPADGSGLGGGHIRLPENSDWTRREMVFDVASDGVLIQFGVGLNGPGQLWVDDVRFEEVPETTPLTDGMLSEPANLDFEK